MNATSVNAYLMYLNKRLEYAIKVPALFTKKLLLSLFAIYLQLTAYQVAYLAQGKG